jgi:TonB-like protein
MKRKLHPPLLTVVRISLALVAASQLGHTSDLQEQLRHQYQGKTFVLRGFYSGELLLYNSSGELIKYETPGDWTADGFVKVDQVHLSGTRTLMDANRQLVIRSTGKFEFRPALQSDPGSNEKKPVTVRVEIDFGTSAPSDVQSEAALSKVFLTQKDSLAFLVPAYWHSCVLMGLLEKDANCQFSLDIYSVLGVALTAQSLIGAVLPDGSSAASAPASMEATQTNSATERLFRIGKDVTPPRALHSPEPEFSDAARGIRYSGILTLGLVVDKEGVPGRIHILSPLGAGLDEKAVHAVAGWRFKPAERAVSPFRWKLQLRSTSNCTSDPEPEYFLSTS